MRIVNERSDAHRASAKDLGPEMWAGRDRAQSVYDELSALNNEMANLQRDLAKKNVQLEALNAEKNRLLGMAAHDLRNPLGIISGFSEFLQSDTRRVLDDEQRAFVAVIRDTAEFMLRMVNNLLDVATIEAGQLKLDCQPADLAAVVTRSVTLNRVLAARKRITVDVAPAPAFPAIFFDRDKIDQCLNNLIGNAVKFAEPGTAVRLELRRDGDEAMVAVKDEGPGIPAEDLPRIFKPFSRASVVATAGEQSTGLGLAIVRRIVEGHGGRIWVETAVGTGSTFFFTLPLRPGH